jgi:hypothetical protein
MPVLNLNRQNFSPIPQFPHGVEPGRSAPSFLGDVLKAPLGAINSVFGALNAPGNVIRGGLQAAASEDVDFDPNILTSLIPFHESIFGLKPKLVSGRDLLETMNIVGENQAGFDMGDVAGFMADLATDPLMFLGPGALGKAGKAAKRLDFLRKDTRSLIQLKRTGVDQGVEINRLIRDNLLEINKLKKAGTQVGSKAERSLFRVYGMDEGVGKLSSVTDPVAKVLNLLPGSQLAKGVGKAIKKELQHLPENSLARQLYDHTTNLTQRRLRKVEKMVQANKKWFLDKGIDPTDPEFIKAFESAIPYQEGEALIQGLRDIDNLARSLTPSTEKLAKMPKNVKETLGAFKEVRAAYGRLIKRIENLVHLLERYQKVRWVSLQLLRNNKNYSMLLRLRLEI